VLDDLSDAKFGEPTFHSVLLGTFA
jgi:hypothetical protein